MDSSMKRIKPLRELNLIDDYMFDVATMDLETCKAIIELSLNIRIQEIEWKEGQKVVHNLPGNREIRLDFYVKDTGIGIADDKKGKVFQRFEKLDEFAQGTGLGLSICKAIAEAMGGKVGFESVHNEGSLFWAFLPCEVDTLSMVEEKKEENISGGEFGANDEVMEKSAGRKTILIAEDIQSNYQLVSTILKDHYDLLHAENGQKAVEIARSQHVDLLLMDMKMPVLDGLKATAEIRKFNASLPIVALTAHAFDSDRIAAIKVGCNEYLVKPLEKMKLMVALKKYL